MKELEFMNNMDLTKDEIIKKAGVKLGINTTGELLDPRFDYVFKRIFTAQEEESKIALMDFLNSILFEGRETITDLSVINNEIPVESYKQKKSRFDILVIFKNGEQALIEMEFRPKDDFVKRSLHNISRLYSAQPINRLNYRKLKKCYMIGVMGYNIFGKEYGYINTFTFRDDQSRQLSGDMQITFIELEKTNEFLNRSVEELTNAECWGLFLRYASFDDKQDVLERISGKKRGIKMAVDVLKYISKSELERLRYEDEILAEIDQEAEIDYALKEEKVRMAIEAIKEGLALELIAKLTKLDISIIRELQEQPDYESDKSE